MSLAMTTIPIGTVPKRSTIWALAITFLSLHAWQGAIAQNPERPRQTFKVRASEVDIAAKEHPEIDFVFERNGKPTDWEHAAVNKRVASRGKLVVWLMQHNGPLFDHLTSYGFHVVQIHYANAWFKKLNIEPPPDDQYLGRIRLEAATGEDFSDAIDIPKPDGISHRTLALLKWLSKEDPDGGWSDFISADSNAVNWDKVTLSGISHGSTTAARFALHQRVDRVVMFSGPRDQLESWYKLPSATPKNRFFGFTHVLDGGWTKDHYCRSWELLGLNEFGPIVNVETSAPPYSNSRRLVSNADVGNNADRAHSASVPGAAAVLNANGKYLHDPVWDYLFTHPVESVGPPVPHDEDCSIR